MSNQFAKTDTQIPLLARGFSIAALRPVGNQVAETKRSGLRPRPKSYARKLVTVISGGVFDLLDPVLERHSFDDLGKAA